MFQILIAKVEFDALELEAPVCNSGSVRASWQSWVPYGDTFITTHCDTGEVFKFNANGPLGSKWIQMPEKSLIGSYVINMLVDSRLFGECDSP